LGRDFIAYTDIKEIVKKLAEAAAEVIGVAQVKLATLALDIMKDFIKQMGKETCSYIGKY